jgi:5-(carboxyamino)imidazole ribonucleotide synthase
VGAPPVVAVLGGGQLGRMLGLAGVPLGATFRFLDPSPDAGAAALGELLVGRLDDLDGVRELVAGADVCTFEWEGVPAASARAAERHVPVRPSPRSLEVAQDRVAEKERFRALGIDTADFVPVQSRADLDAAVAQLGFPAMLKTRRGGYDGKGQRVLAEPADVEAAWSDLRGAPLVLERFVAFERELSIVAVRSLDGSTSCWPVVENAHHEGILRVTRAPAPSLDDPTRARAEEIARLVLDDLGHVGVGCIELFQQGARLLANELAPRVHNSGHWTIEAAETSQFENHVRAVLGWPIGPTRARGVAAMVNCIGALPDRAAVLALPGAHLHDYAKLPRVGRKVGHVTLVAPDAASLDARLAPLLDLAGPPA